MGNSVFISYSKKDRQFLDDLRVHLSYLEREYKFEIWEDSKIQVGDDWRKEIYKAIDHTKIAILLVSANFIASDFINSEELPALLDIAERKGAKIFSIILSHCMFIDIESIAKLQSFNPPNQPVIEMNLAEKDAFFMNVTKEVKKVLVDKSKPKKPKGYKIEASSLEYAFIKVNVVKLINENPIGMSISEIQKELVIQKRKHLVEILQQLVLEDIVLKIKITNKTCYSLSDKGNKICSEYAQHL